MTDRTAKKAAIKRASASARNAMDQLDADTLDKLTALYRDAVDGLHNIIDSFADSDSAVPFDTLQALLAAAESRLKQLEAQRTALLNSSMNAAALLGVKPFLAAAARLTSNIIAIPEQAITFVQRFVADDGLQLSDRIWRTDNHARQIVRDAINQAVIQGHSASRAAQELLSSGQPGNSALQAKLKANAAGPLKKTIEQQLFGGVGTPYDNAKRLFRTEINRANGQAYQATAFSHPDIIGTRFLLSPNHPKHDICDMHAHANIYGLGAGVYPQGKNPWPAHPNTLSYTEVVFADEVTDSDKQGKQAAISWLNDQPIAVQESVLNSRFKRIALQKGLLPATAIATPWRDLKPRLEKQGHNTDTWGN